MTSPCRRPRAVLPAILAALLAAAPAASHAQERSERGAERPAPADAFGETIDVRVVNVEAVVTDKDGQRVTGLGRDDFRLVVDGEEVPVEYFTEVRGGVAAPAGEGAAAPPPGAAAGGPVGTSYLLFVDDLMTRPADRDRTLERLRDQLPSLEAGDRMAVVAFDGKGLEMLSNWSASARQLEDALAAAAERPAYGLFWLAERHAAARDQTLVPGPDRFDVSRLGFHELNYAERVVARVERAVDGATAALRAFGRPPGRKVMLLVAGEWPFATDRWAAEGGRFVHDPTIPSGERLYGPLVDAANLLGYTLYPADARGLDPERLGDDGPLPNAASTGLSRETLVHETFQYLAQETGGRAWLNARGGDALAETAADTRSYYWLGFTARRAGDADRHKIRVKVVRPGLEVRARENFRDLSRRDETSLAVESAVRFGDLPEARPLPAEVSRPRKAGMRRMEVKLEAAIPLDMVTLVPAPGGGVAGRVELRVAALDEHGETAEVPVIEVDLRLPSRPPPGKYSLYETWIKLRRARQRLLVTVHDAPSGQAAAFMTDVRP